MKKSILLMLLIMVQGVMGVDIGINLVEYHEETQYSRIHVSNEMESDLTGVTLQIGESSESKIVEILKPGQILYAIRTIPPGKHMITVNSNEGISESKELSFSFSKEDFLKEQERMKEEAKREENLKEIAKTNLINTQRQVEDEVKRAADLGVIEKKVNVILILILIGVVVIIGGVMYWLIKKKGKL